MILSSPDSIKVLEQKNAYIYKHELTSYLGLFVGINAEINPKLIYDY